jgi:hypothetical protein
MRRADVKLSTAQKLTDAERHKRFVETAKKAEASDKARDFDKAFGNLDVHTNRDSVTKPRL